jgi:hypothetical protein
MIRQRVGTAAHRALADTIAARAFTLVRDANAGIPLRARSRVLSVTVARRPDLTAGTYFDATLRAAGYAVRSVYVDADVTGGGEFTGARAIADSVDAVIVGSYVATRWDAATIRQSAGFVDFVRALTAGGKRPVVVAFGNPYLLQQVSDVPGYAVAWSGGQPAQVAAARGVAGLARISARLPISIPPIATRGAGLSREVAR